MISFPISTLGSWCCDHARLEDKSIRKVVIYPRPAHVGAVVQRQTVNSSGLSCSYIYIQMVFDRGVLILTKFFCVTLLYPLKVDKDSRRISYNKEMLRPVLSKRQPQALVGSLELEA